MVGALIVIFVLVFLLGNWRGGLIVASTIPLSLLFAFIMMHSFGVWANLMSLGAIDFGIIIDGAVIIVESTVFMSTRNNSKKQNITGKIRDDVAYKSSSKMMNSAFFGQLIILIVFIPILALRRCRRQNVQANGTYFHVCYDWRNDSLFNLCSHDVGMVYPLRN